MEKERLTSNLNCSCRICDNSFAKSTNQTSHVNRNNTFNNRGNIIDNSKTGCSSYNNGRYNENDACSSTAARTREVWKSNAVRANILCFPDGYHDRDTGRSGYVQIGSSAAFYTPAAHKNLPTSGEDGTPFDNNYYICETDIDANRYSRTRVDFNGARNDGYELRANYTRYICDQDGGFYNVNTGAFFNGYYDMDGSIDTYEKNMYEIANLGNVTRASTFSDSTIENNSFCSKCNESIMRVRSCEVCRSPGSNASDAFYDFYSNNFNINGDTSNRSYNGNRGFTRKSSIGSFDYDTALPGTLSGIFDTHLFIGESTVGVNGEFPGVWNELRQNDQLCDGVIKCRDGRAVKVHRAILSAVSPYFRAIFTNSLRAGGDEETQITVDIESSLLESLLDYAYTGACAISSDNVEALLPAADQYEVLGVINLCCQYLFHELRPENCLGILRFAKHYFCRELEYNAMHYTLINFKRVMEESTEFSHLQFQELSAILRDDELNVRTEEAVVEAIKAWTEFDPSARVAYVPELLTTVRFGLMSFKYFTSHVFKWDVIQQNVACQEALYPASIFLTELNSKECTETDLNDPLARPRIPNEILFAIGGWSAGSPTSFVETYDVRSDRWFLSVSTDLTPRAYHGICTLDNTIYMVGGFDGNEHFNTVRCYNPLTKVWRERACMYHARCYVSVVAHDGWIYAMGGYNGRTRMCSVERYDPNRNQWEMVTPMNKQRSDASAASLKNKIYVVGGFNGQEVLVSGEVYDPNTLQWTFIPQMLNPRSGVSLVAYRGALYALGGFSGFSRLNSGEKYDPDGAGEWVPIADMFSPRSNFATVVIDEMIYAIGGFNGTTTIAYVECYDGDANEWYDAACMNLNRSALSACVLKGLPNGRDYSYLTKAQEHEEGGGPAKSHKSHVLTSR